MFVQILIAVVALLFSRFLWRRWKYDLHRVPSPPRERLFGHTRIANKPSQQLVMYLNSQYKNLGYPKLLRVDVMGSPLLFVTDVDFIRDIMMSKTAPFPRFIARSSSIVPLIGNDTGAKFMFRIGTLTAYPKAIRKVYATAMQAQNLKKVTPEIIKRIDALIDIIENRRKHGQVDLKELFTRLTVDVIGAMALETNMGGLDGSRDIHRLFGEVKAITMQSFGNPMLALYWRLIPWSREARRRNKKIQALLDAYTKLIQELQQRDDPVDGHQPIWYALKTMKDPETGEPLTSKTLLAEVAFLILAGMDSTAQQLGWIMMLLASHPRVTEKLLEELKEHGLYGPGSRAVQFDDLGDLSYVTAIIKEAMRMTYILTTLGVRRVPEDMDIVGYRIPKGTRITTPGTRALNSEKEWGDPEVFRPERWLTGEDMSDKYNMAFSVGPRDCIGQKLAMLEMRLSVVKLMTQYELRIDGKWQDILNSANDGVIIEALNGVWFHMSPRQNMSSN